MQSTVPTPRCPLLLGEQPAAPSPNRDRDRGQRRERLPAADQHPSRSSRNNSAARVRRSQRCPPGSHVQSPPTSRGNARAPRGLHLMDLQLRDPRSSPPMPVHAERRRPRPTSHSALIPVTPPARTRSDPQRDPRSGGRSPHRGARAWPVRPVLGAGHPPAGQAHNHRPVRSAPPALLAGRVRLDGDMGRVDAGPPRRGDFPAPAHWCVKVGDDGGGGPSVQGALHPTVAPRSGIDRPGSVVRPAAGCRAGW